MTAGVAMEVQVRSDKRSTDAQDAALRLRTDPDPAVRAKAALALDGLRDAGFLAEFMIALNDPDWFVRSNAGWELVHLGEIARQPVEVVVRAGLNPEAREMAALVLERLVTPSLGALA